MNVDLHCVVLQSVLFHNQFVIVWSFCRADSCVKETVIKPAGLGAEDPVPLPRGKQVE